MRRLCLKMLLLTYLLAACTGPGQRIRPATLEGGETPSRLYQDGVGGSGEEPAASEWAALGQVTPEQQAAEWSRAVAEMYRNVEDIDSIGTEVEFRYFVSRGALTLD